MLPPSPQVRAARHAYYRCAFAIGLWPLLAMLVIFAVGCQPIVAPTPTAAQRLQGVAASPPTTPTVVIMTAKSTITQTVELTPTVTATPAITDTATLTLTTDISPTLSAHGAFPPGAEILDESEFYTLALIPKPIEEVESYFLANTTDMHLLERLWVDMTEYRGKAFFLLFWQAQEDGAVPPVATCIYAFEERTEQYLGIYVMRGECGGLRFIAEIARRAPWQRVRDFEWSTWEEGNVSFIYPPYFQIDEERQARASCQNSDKRCPVSFTQNDKRKLIGVNLEVSPRHQNASTMDYAAEEYDQVHGIGIGKFQHLTSFPILLYQGQEAIQSIYIYFTAEGIPAISVSIHAVTEDEYYLFVGSVINGTYDLSEDYAIIGTAVRSLTIKPQPEQK